MKIGSKKVCLKLRLGEHKNGRVLEGSKICLKGGRWIAIFR